MSVMMDILEELTPLNRVFCSSDYDRALEFLRRRLPFETLEFPASEPHNGWEIPPRWDVEEAKILRDGEVIWDGTEHALRVIALSEPFEGTVSREELRDHLHHDDRYDDAVPFHFRQQYRPWDRDWGFCVTRDFYEALEPGEYEVVIRTRESEGTLKLLEHTHEGELDATVVFLAHLDHPGMANDDLAGCAVGVELFRRLHGRDTKLSYRLLLHQEVVGSEYYLASLSGDERDRIIEGLFLEMLGTESELGLQAARGEAPTSVRVVLDRALRDRDVPFRRGDYGDIVVNGEYVWDAWGIPVASLSRYPYPEYHTDRDDVSIISEEALETSVEVLLDAVDALESAPMVYRDFAGTICTSNPRYDLYVDPGQAAFGGFTDDETVRGLRELMELLPGLDEPVSAQALAERVGLGLEPVVEYLERWEEKGLVELR